MEDALSKQVLGLNIEIATVIRRLAETNKLIANDLIRLESSPAIRTAAQYHRFADLIQYFNDGIKEFSIEHFVPYGPEKMEMKRFYKEIFINADPFAYELPTADKELPMAMFQSTRNLSILKYAWEKYCPYGFAWNPKWDDMILSNNETRPKGPYWYWHSGDTEAPAMYQDHLMHANTAAHFAAMDIPFMDPAEYITFVIYMQVRKRVKIDQLVRVISPRALWRDNSVPCFNSTFVKSLILGVPPKIAADNLYVRPIRL